MSEETALPALTPDEPLGDVGDQASRLQMAQEQEAIRAALEGRVHGTDAIEDRGALVEPLEGEDPMAAEEAEASDDPLHGGGDVAADAGGAEERPSLDDDLVEVMAVDEGSSVDDASAVPLFEEDGDPDEDGPQTD